MDNSSGAKRQIRKFGGAEAPTSSGCDIFSQMEGERPSTLAGAMAKMAGEAGQSAAGAQFSGGPTTFQGSAGEPSTQRGVELGLATQESAAVTPAVQNDMPQIIEQPFSDAVFENDNEFLQYAGEWRTTMQTPDYIGDKDLLLQYLYSLERLHKITMPLRACGIDRILFDNVNYLQGENDNQLDLFGIPHPISKNTPIPGVTEIPKSDEVTQSVEGMPVQPASGEEQGMSVYEIIEVDGALYMSCVSECLDRDYLNSVLAEATTAIKSTGRYIYGMVDYRKLALVNGEPEGRLLNTLRLNTYEMNVLCCYMGKFPGMQKTFEVIDGKQCIRFTLKSNAS